MEESLLDYRLDVFNKYLTIKKDLMENLSDVYNRQNYYTRKYRGNLLLDINVGIGEQEEDPSLKEIQIFVRFKGLYIKDNIVYNSKDYFKSTIKTNLNE